MAVDLEAEIVNYVPDEVCVLVRASETADTDGLYEEVRQTLNPALGHVLASSAALPDDPLARDLEPVELRARFGAGSEVLHPLVRHGIGSQGATNGGARPPWHRHATDANEVMHHFYYAMGTDRVDFHRNYLDERLRRLACVRELVNLVNHPPVGLAAVAGERWSLVSGAPNWLTVAAQIACGSPAGPAQPESRTGRWRFRFDPALESQLAAPPVEDPADVVVAILDAAPDSADVPTHGNAYLAEVLRAIHMHTANQASPALHPDYFRPPGGVQHYVDGVQPWWSEPADVANGFTIQDHGLFVAGIVYDVAPNAEIHLIRVLNERGIGDALALGHILSDLPREMAVGGRRRLIVNLSLGATVPVPPSRHSARWFPTAHTAGAMSDSAARQLLDAAHSSLLSIVSWLHRQGVLVVAAAGNDALRRQTRHVDEAPPPRYPARYKEVFAVAAAEASGAPASYSNRADVVARTNGITSFGGELGGGKGVVGIYSSDAYPQGQANTTGWAQWAGTSFATPLIAGVAARLWAQSSHYQPADLMERIRSYAKPMASSSAPDADPDGPLDAPLLPAWQEYQPSSG